MREEHYVAADSPEDTEWERLGLQETLFDAIITEKIWGQVFLFASRAILLSLVRAPIINQ